MPRNKTWGEGLRCLVVGSDPGSHLKAPLIQAGFTVITVDTDRDAIATLEREPVFLIVVDHDLGAGAAGRIIARGRQCHPPTPTIVLGATSAIDEAVEAMRLGAADYLPPPFDEERTLNRLRRLVEARPRNEPSLDGTLPGFMGLVGNSPVMRTLFATVERVARYKTNVLLLGESGTGKELIARALHALGPRRRSLFVPLNCATLGRDLLENELFGHERGAFTGATERKKGLFELADGGTLLLDEIGEMDPGLQAKLLRVLERNEFRRVGGTEKVKVDFTLIASTNRELQEAIRLGQFREDLFYRLQVVTIVVPPLRERREDIPALIDSFIADFNRRNNGKIRGISPLALRRFMEHSWPGNVRELKNAVESAAVLASGDTIGAEIVPGTHRSVQAAAGATSIGAGNPSARRSPEPSTDFVPIPADSTLETAERILIEAQLRRGRSREEAAQALGIGSRTIYAKLRKYRASGAR